MHFELKKQTYISCAELIKFPTSPSLPFPMCRYYKKVLRSPLVTSSTKIHRAGMGQEVGNSILGWAVSQLI